MKASERPLPYAKPGLTREQSVHLTCGCRLQRRPNSGLGRRELSGLGRGTRRLRRWRFRRKNRGLESWNGRRRKRCALHSLGTRDDNGATTRFRLDAIHVDHKLLLGARARGRRKLHLITCTAHCRRFAARPRIIVHHLNARQGSVNMQHYAPSTRGAGVERTTRARNESLSRAGSDAAHSRIALAYRGILYELSTGKGTRRH